MKTRTLLLSIMLLLAFSLSATVNPVDSIPIDLIEVSSDFCDGWEEGYQDALEGCLKVGVTPLCPIPPVGKDSYKHGYGMGYAKGEKKCD